MFAIGNINQNNIEIVSKKGAKRIAVIRAIAKAKNPKIAAWQLKRKLNYL